MNDRQRFIATMHFQPRDRSPICDFGFWEETPKVWHAQGLPKRCMKMGEVSQFLGMDSGCVGHVAGNPGLCPNFGWKQIEDRGDHEVAQTFEGIQVLRKKVGGSIPIHVGHLLVDRQSWREHYKPRLDPDHPLRMPQIQDKSDYWHDPDRAVPLNLGCGSLYGWLRNWMGMENLSLVVYDDPAWFGEMVETIADCVIGTLEKVFAVGGNFESGLFWEDMCYNAGPLLSPTHFKAFLVPQYRRITDLLRKHGVDVVIVDCDGKIDALAPLWLEGGVNCMFPLEVGVWKADPLQFRKEYGRELLLMGGIDKHMLAGSREEIRREVERLTPLVEEGGYIGFCDHRVPPDVPLDNYVYYLQTVRKLWGRNFNLNPMGKIRRPRKSVAASPG